MDLITRVRSLLDYLRGSLWFLPSLAVLGALVAGELLSRVRIGPGSPLSAVVGGTGVDGARGMLQVVAGSVITVTSVTFSLTVVALVTAASLYSPRVLRTFLRDHGNQLVLSTFLATFAYSIVVLRTIRAGGEDSEAFVPRVAVGVAVLLALASVAALVYFIHHITQSIRVETIMTRVEHDTRQAIDSNYAVDEDGAAASHEAVAVPPPHAVALHARGSGYLQALGPEALVGLAAERDVVVWYRRTVGEHVTAGTVLAWAWRVDDKTLGDDGDRFEIAVNQAAQFGHERTLQEDVAFGFRLLVDIAIRALSPALNDPTTAVACLGHLTSLLAVLAGRATGPDTYDDTNGTVRVGLPRLGFADYLSLSCSQIANYGGGDIAAVRGVLRLLQDVGGVVADDERRAAVAAEIDHTLAHAKTQLELDDDRDLARIAGREARHALRGDVTLPNAFVL